VKGHAFDIFRFSVFRFVSVQFNPLVELRRVSAPQSLR
jgi:hypothetical protein